MAGPSLSALANLAAAVLGRLSGTAPDDIPVLPPPTRTAAERRLLLGDLVAAYPGHLAGADETLLHWRTGPPTPIGRPAGTAAAVLSDDPAIADLFAWDYPLTAHKGGTAPLGDPGRARPAALFGRMYGDCRKGEVQRRLAEVAWVGGRRVRFTRENGAAEALAAVARDLEKLGPAYAPYLWPLSGTFNCRVVAGTRSASMHAYGAAIDLASRYGAYWRWRRSPGPLLPGEIVRVFEDHGFIWGGKWAHFDTFHFEYRPELIRAARRATSNTDPI